MKRREEEPQENVERWMLTYLDMITLLMAFFCILFAFAQVDAAKFKQVAQSMSIAFGSGSGGSGQTLLTNYSGNQMVPQLSSNSLITLRENNEFKSIIKLLRDYAAQHNMQDKMKVKITSRGLETDFFNEVLFESGKADLSPTTRSMLDTLGEFYLAKDRSIQVEGHTDNVPIHNEKYQSNWQLSTDRATNVIMYWISKYPDKAANLSASGYGEYNPLYSNDTQEGKAMNRRVRIILLRKSESQKDVKLD